ncbi:MAG: extracellular solute-binding protein [Eubacteriales bacterium]|nr:extracellular solute-binding protein [Eubacteriales bacterium]
MKRKWMTLVLTMAMTAGLLAGCGSSQDTADAVQTEPAAETSAAAEQEVASDEPVTLEMWGMTDDEERYKAVIEEYTALHPNVTINLTAYSSTEIDQALTTALAGKENIDLFVSNGSQYLESRISTGMAEPLNDYITASGFDTSIYGEAFPATAVNDQYYGLPCRDSVAVLVYNKTYFDEKGVAYPTADTTWDELLDIAEQMTWGEGADKVWGLFNAARNTDWNGMAFHNSVFSTSDDLTLLGKAMEWKLDAVDRGVMMDNAAYTANGVGIRAMFSSGMSSMYFGGDWTIAQLNGDIESGAMDFEWDIAPMPMMDDGSGRMKTMGQYVYFSVCSYSENKQAAYDFMTYLCGHEGALCFAKDGSLPGAKQFDDVKEAFMKTSESTGCPANISLYFELEGVQPPIVPGYGEVEVLVKQEADLVFSRMESVDEALDNIYSGRESMMSGQ